MTAEIEEDTMAVRDTMAVTEAVTIVHVAEEETETVIWTETIGHEEVSIVMVEEAEGTGMSTEGDQNHNSQ